MRILLHFKTITQEQKYVSYITYRSNMAKILFECFFYISTLIILFVSSVSKKVHFDSIKN